MRIIIFLFIIFCAEKQAMGITLVELRVNYQASANSEYSCKLLMSLLHSYNVSNNTTLAAYNACVTMIMAKHVFNPISKFAYFNQGRELLEKCVTIDKENVEIRYLRFTIQSNSPAFLGYNNSIVEDKTFLIKAYAYIKDLQLKQMISSFLKSSQYVSLLEKQNIKS